MRQKITYLLILFLCILFFNGKTNQVEAEGQLQRIKFEIRVFAEDQNKSEVLTKAHVEGLPGTDFRINLNTGNFKMEARFLSDLISREELKLRVKLETRRFYGKSPIDLPLYEEDKQEHTLKIGFDQKIVLLPFGRNGSSETLKIEIKPTVLFVAEKSRDSKRLLINFDKMINTGEIEINASKNPHKFEVEAILLANGNEVASGKGNFLLEEPGQIVLTPDKFAPKEIQNKSLKTELTVDRFIRGRPNDFASIRFNLSEPNSAIKSDKRRPVLAGGKGISQIGKSLIYRVDGISKEKKYEIKFRVDLSREEK